MAQIKPHFPSYLWHFSVSLQLFKKFGDRLKKGFVPDLPCSWSILELNATYNPNKWWVNRHTGWIGLRMAFLLQPCRQINKVETVKQLLSSSLCRRRRSTKRTSGVSTRSAVKWKLAAVEAAELAGWGRGSCRHCCNFTGQYLHE